MRKNAVFELTIDDVNADGFGVGRVEGFAVFVDGALPGERVRVRAVKVKSRYAYGKMEKILVPSLFRIDSRKQPEGESLCPVSSRCGGCQFQHCQYATELVFKQKFVLDALERIGHLESPPVLDIIGMEKPYHYRNKAQFPVGVSTGTGTDTGVGIGGGAVIGFYALRSHRIVPVTHCGIQHPSHEKILATVYAYIKQYKVAPYDEAAHTGLLRHILIKAGVFFGEVMVVLIVNGLSLPHEEALAEQLTHAGATTVLINENTARTNTAMGRHTRVLCGDGHIREKLGEIIYRLSARSFFQVNPLQTKILYDTVLAFGSFTGSEIVADLYAGVGGIALYIAEHVRFVYGVEIVPEAVEDARFNAALNKIGNARFLCGASEDVLPTLIAGDGEWLDGEMESGYLNGADSCHKPGSINTVILDPPRKGCDASLLNVLITAQIARLIYVSCDPSTLARDVKRLCEGGYLLKKVQPVDMFPRTGEVECVAFLVT